MNQTKFLLISIVVLGIVTSSACGSQSVQQPQALPSVAPESTSIAQPSSPSIAPVSTVMSQPDVSTSLPSESTPLSGVQTATDMPTELPIPTGGGKTVTLDDRGKTISLAVGESFLLKLGETYNWDISISDQSVISRVKNIMVIRGAQGVYDALKPGTATLTATGDPLCRSSQPACAMPSILFEVTIEVK